MQEDSARERLDALIRQSGEGYAALSRMLGRNPAYLQQYVKRGVPRRLAELDRRRLAQHFGVNERLLGAPGGAHPEPAPEKPEPVSGEPCRYLLVPYLDPSNGRAIAGPPKAALALDPGFAMQISAGRPASLATHRIEGDSMVPILTDGDNVLVDTDDRWVVRDGIYALRTASGILVKRISVHPVSKRLSILSDNPAYPSFSDCDPAAIGIIGRIIWAGHRIA